MDTATKIPDQAARERLASSLQAMVDEAEHLLESAQKSGGEHFAAARDKLAGQMRHARHELDALQDTAAYNVRRAARVADHAVHEHPYAAVGLAAGVGVLVGMLISRR